MSVYCRSLSPELVLHPKSHLPGAAQALRLNVFNFHEPLINSPARALYRCAASISEQKHRERALGDNTAAEPAIRAPSPASASHFPIRASNRWRTTDKCDSCCWHTKAAKITYSRSTINSHFVEAGSEFLKIKESCTSVFFFIIEIMHNSNIVMFEFRLVADYHSFTTQILYILHPFSDLYDSSRLGCAASHH